MLTRPIRVLKHGHSLLLRDLQADKDGAVLLLRNSTPVLWIQLCSQDQAEWAIEAEGCARYSFRDLIKRLPVVEQELHEAPGRHGVLSSRRQGEREPLWAFLTAASADDLTGAPMIHTG